MNNHNELPIIIVGTGGHAGIVLDLITAQGGWHMHGWIDDYRTPGEYVMSHPVLGSVSAMSKLFANQKVHVVLAIGDNDARHQIMQRILDTGLDCEWPTLIHPTAIISPNAVISRGVVICAAAVVNNSARIAQFALINTAAIVEHDAQIDEFASLGPRATVAGGASVAHHAVVAMAASLLQRRQIGHHAILGAGAVAVHDIPPLTVALGIPAKSSHVRIPGCGYL